MLGSVFIMNGTCIYISAMNYLTINLWILAKLASQNKISNHYTVPLCTLVVNQLSFYLIEEDSQPDLDVPLAKRVHLMREEEEGEITRQTDSSTGSSSP